MGRPKVKSEEYKKDKKKWSIRRRLYQQMLEPESSEDFWNKFQDRLERNCDGRP